MRGAGLGKGAGWWQVILSFDKLTKNPNLNFFCRRGLGRGGKVRDCF